MKKFDGKKALFIFLFLFRLKVPLEIQHFALLRKRKCIDIDKIGVNFKLVF